MTDEKLDQILKQALAPKIDDAEIRIYKKARVQNMSRENRIGRRGVPAAAAIALAILLAGGGTVLAACRYFGLLDFTGNLREDIPKEATKFIEREIEQTVEEDTDDTIIDCTVKEALCDSETIMIVYEVSAKESGKYLFVPEDATEDLDMSGWSDISGITAGEYASEKGLSILYIGGGILNTDELGIAESSMSFRSVADDVMDVYVRCGKLSDAKSFDVRCAATAWAAGDSDVIRREMQFTLEDMSNAVVRSYNPVVQSVDNAVIEIIGADVIQTELGTYVDIRYNSRQNDVLESVSFRLKASDGRVLDWNGGSGIEFSADGSYRTRLIMNKEEIGDSFVVEIYDYIENVVYETVQME